VGRALAGGHRRAVLATKVGLVDTGRPDPSGNTTTVVNNGRPEQYVVPIPGTKTPKFLADNAAAADLELSAADLAELDAVPAPQGARY
jgi:hypothetical protein